MSFNGSGTFLINSTGQPVVANTVISATVFNALTADLASGLTNCITKDGQSTPTANIPMGSNKITGLAVGTLINDAATLGQVQSTAAKLIGSISGVDTVLGIMSPTLTAYAAGQLFYYIAAGANTGAVTLNIDGLGAKAVTRDGSTALAAGDINSGEIVVVIYDGTRFQMINAANSFGNTTINGTLTVTGNTGLQANVSITSTLSVGGTFAVTGAATLGSTLAVTGKADLPTVSTASINAAVAVVTTGTVTNLTSTSASIASVNAGVALLTTATVTDLTASSASIASANIGNLQFTAASIASINAGVAVVTNLTATSASIASANVGTAVITTGTVTNLTSTSASIASANAAVALVTTGTVTNLTSTSASIASANLGTAVVTTGTVTNLTATSASIASANAGTAVVTNLTATGASIASANVGTGVVTTLTATQASVGSINAAVALVTNGTVTTLSGTQASITSANHAVLRLLGSVSGYVGLQGAAAAGSTTYTLPSADGSSGQVLSTNGSGTLSWATGGGGGTGDVVGPASATDNAITRFDLTTGKLIQNSTVILDDAGTITGVAALAAVTVSVTSANAGTATITTGNLGIGGTAQGNIRVHALGDFAVLGGNANSTAFGATGTIPTSITSTARGFYTSLTTAASFTLSNLYHFQASNVNVGAGATVTNQIGFLAGSGLNTATNNYGFYSDIASGSNRWNFYANGTADNYFAGNVGIGTTTIGLGGTATRLQVANANIGTLNTQANLMVTTTDAQAANVGGIIGLGGSVATASPTANMRLFGAIRGAKDDATDGNTNGYLAFYTMGSGTTTASERMRISSSGSVGIGGTADAYARIHSLGTLPTSSNITVANFSAGTIPSGATSVAYGYYSNLGTQAASFTCTSIIHNYVNPGTFGAGSTVSNQYGYYVDTTLTGATNNYGFFSNIASGSNRYNFYAAGTAQNYFAGRLGINNTAFVDNEMLRVTQSNANTGVFVDITAASSTASAGIAIRKQDNNNTTAQTYMAFAYNAGASGAGGIQGNGGTGPQFFNSSDARLKENVSDLDGQLAKIMALKPRTFDFINGPKGCTGFIAQEMEEIYPDAIGETPDGYKTIGGVSVMEARLIKAIQELSAKVAALEAK